MSSILDALKKAEQISAAGRRKSTPWPAPPSAPTSEHRHMRRWWMGFGVAVIAGALIAIFWTTRKPATTLPAASVKTASPPAAQKVKPGQTLAQKTRPLPARSRAPAQPSQNTARPTRIDHQTPPAAAPQTAARISKKSILAQTTAHRQPTTTNTRPSSVSAPTPANQQKGDSAYPVRNDPRIKLQALVWSSEAVDRFVIINDRLIKEGGSVDDIVVVRIDRDDVLLSEGPDRWREPFKVH